MKFISGYFATDFFAVFLPNILFDSCKLPFSSFSDAWIISSAFLNLCVEKNSESLYHSMKVRIVVVYAKAP